MVDDDEAPLIYGVEFQVRYVETNETQSARIRSSFCIQARALCAVTGVPDDDTVRFLVGTQSLKFENQVSATREWCLLIPTSTYRFTFSNMTKIQGHWANPSTLIEPAKSGVWPHRRTIINASQRSIRIVSDETKACISAISIRVFR